MQNDVKDHDSVNYSVCDHQLECVFLEKKPKKISDFGFLHERDDNELIDEYHGDYTVPPVLDIRLGLDYPPLVAEEALFICCPYHFSHCGIAPIFFNF